MSDGHNDDIVAELDDRFVESLDKLLIRDGRPQVLTYPRSDDIPDEVITIKADCLSAMQYHANRFNPKRQINFCLLWSKSIGAYAYRMDDKYIICISAGTDQFLSRLFRNISSIQEISSIFGIIQPTEGKARKYNSSSSFIRSLSETEPTNESPETSCLAKVLADIGMMFLIFHEYCHLSCGHIDYLRPNGNFGFGMSEFVHKIADKDIALSCRTLEHDADAFACIQAWELMRHSSKFNSSPLTKLIFNSPIKQGQAFIVSIIFLFMAFEPQHTIPNDLRTHAIPAWRAPYSLDALMELFVNRDHLVNSYDTFTMRVSQPAIRNIYKIILERTDDDFFQQMSKYYDIVNHPEAFAQINSRWSLLRPKLQELSISPFRLALAENDPA